MDDYISLKMDAEQMTPGVRDVTYYLDKMGNRQSVVDTSTTTSYTPNNLNEYSAVQGSTIVNNSQVNLYQHEMDRYGPVNNVVNYFYRNDEQLTRVTAGSNTYSLAYDALGRCVQRTINGVNKYYIYDGERPILEYDGAGALAAWNVYGKGIDEILMRTDYTFNPVRTYYLQHDHEGSVIHVTDTSGTLIERYRYDAYGAPTIYGPSPTATPFQPQASAVSNRFMFTGREYAGAFGFYEYRARAYHPGLGRFTSEDPKLFDAGDYNLFRYCRNDPEDITDPMGLDPEFWLIRDYVGHPANSFEARRAAGDLYVRDNGTYTSLGRTNENSFRGQSMGVKQGDYKLVPRGERWGPGYPSDQPAITGKQAGLKPGQPNESYKNPALVHEKDPSGKADSTACVTCNPETVARVKQIMRENNNNVPFHIREPARPAKAQSEQQAPSHPQPPEKPPPPKGEGSTSRP